MSSSKTGSSPPRTRAITCSSVHGCCRTKVMFRWRSGAWKGSRSYLELARIAAGGKFPMKLGPAEERIHELSGAPHAWGEGDLVQLDPDHPGFRDPAYLERRNAIARIALTFK